MPQQGDDDIRNRTEADYQRLAEELIRSDYVPRYRPEEDTEANGMVEMQRIFLKLHQRKLAERDKKDK